MSLARDVPTLDPPPDNPEDLRDFPADELPPDRPFFRVSRRDYSPWWFGSALFGRFDLAHPQGTCYLAEDEIGALLEAIGAERRGGALSTCFLAARRLYRLRLPRGHYTADCTSRRAVRFGITAELGTIVPYDLPQAWAARLYEGGFEGMVYRLRHDPLGTRAVALFGCAGERTDWPIDEDHMILGRLEERLKEECGIYVLDVPSLEDLDLLE